MNEHMMDDLNAELTFKEFLLLGCLERQNNKIIEESQTPEGTSRRLELLLHTLQGTFCNIKTITK
jgi:hypothetical protein